MKPRLASSAILLRNGKVLLVLRNNPPAEQLHAFPGGKTKAFEAPAQTAVREFFEETGIGVKNPVKFSTFDLPSSDGISFFLTVFLVDDIDSRVAGKAADDAAAFGWYSHMEIAKLDVPQSVRICAQELARTGRI